MDISRPPTEYLSHIDEQLAALEEETRIMKQKFGFDKVSEAESIMQIRKKQKAAAQLKRYDEEGKV